MTRYSMQFGAAARRSLVAVVLFLIVLVGLARSASAQTVLLTVDLTGQGTGTVVSSPAGLTTPCTGTAVTCTGTFGPSTTVTLTATPASGHTFGGWSGACTGAGTCTVKLPATGGLLVAATFHPPPAYVFYHHDAIGSVRAVTTEAGAVLARYDYEPFGEDSVPVTDRIGFGGKELDGDTAQQYFGARYYRNLYGQFTTVDPVMDQENAIAEPQLWNRYAYVTNNPLRFRDPDGRERVGILLDQNVRALMSGSITRDEYNARIEAAGAGAGIGAAVAAVVLGGPTAWRAAVGCFLSSACRTAGMDTLEEVADGRPRLGAAGDGVIAAKSHTIGSKVANQMGPRGWTRTAIDEAKALGQQVRATNKANGNPATRYVHPYTGQSVVIDDVTGEVIHVGGPGFDYGPASGDLP